MALLAGRTGDLLLQDFEARARDAGMRMGGAEAGLRDGHGGENFWSLLKRMLKGTCVGVEPFRDLAEQTFRFNNRKATDWERFKRILGVIGGERLEYVTLVTEEGPV